MNRDLYKGPVALGIGFVCVMIGTVIIGIWSFQLKQIADSFPIVMAMQFNTALCLVLLGTAFMLTFYRHAALVYALTATTAMVAGFTLYQRGFGRNQRVLRSDSWLSEAQLELSINPSQANPAFYGDVRWSTVFQNIF